jgi:hypothetical protein
MRTSEHRRGRGLGRAYARWLSWLTLCLAVLLAPGVSELAREGVLLLTSVACCDDGEGCADEDCKGSPGQCGSCAHCAFCAHPNAVASAALLPCIGAAAHGLTLRWQLEGMRRSGYRAPPFRPPSA